MHTVCVCIIQWVVLAQKPKKKKCTQNKTNKILKVLAVPILNFEQQCAQPDLVRHEVSVLYLMENGVDTGLLD